MSDIEKKIAFKIQHQFPAIYRDEGSELVAFVEQYYKFVEQENNMGVYHNRRMFEHRDIATTLSEMIVFFQKKFCADLPLDDDTTVKFIVRNILSLYRRKGSESGIILFFRLFYAEDVEIYYPASNIFKPSDSSWKEGAFLQLFPNNAEFKSNETDAIYEYAALAGKNIIGSISEARAAVNKINIVMLNKTLTPIIYINDVKGTFEKFDNIIAKVNGEDISFGIVQGSASAIDIDETKPRTTDNELGDIFKFESLRGRGGKCIVTDLQDEFTGTISYTITDGGWGYTVANTELIVSDQVIILDNEDEDFVIEERLRDASGNEGIVTGQNKLAVGVYMNAGDEFDGTAISTLDRDTNVTFQPADFSVSEKNSSSPGDLFPKTGDDDDVKVGQLENVQNIGLIQDKIADFLGVSINSTNYNTVPPAVRAMSGTADPVTLATPLNQAFDLTPISVGTVKTFININPGSSYENDVFAIVRDQVFRNFERKNQILVLDVFDASFDVGDTITQPSTGVSGKIIATNTTGSYLEVLPYAYYGFTNADILHKGNTYELIVTETAYDSDIHGENGEITTLTEFSEGRISEVKIINSGIGYIDGETVDLIDDEGTVHATGKLSCLTQGITEGYFGNYNSHIQPSNKIRDNDFYQEYSYEIQGVIDPQEYEEVLKRTVHPAGTKSFNRFVYKQKIKAPTKSRFQLIRKDDYVPGGDPIVGPGQTPGEYVVSSDKTDITVDSTIITSDII